MPNWMDAFRNKKEKEKEDEDDDLELKAVTDKIGKIDDIEKSFKEFKEKGEKDSTRLNSFLDEQEAAKRRRQAEELAAKAAKENKETSDELEELALTDPKRAAELIADAKMKPLQVALINTQSQILRKQIFDDNAAEFEYYTNDNVDFKKMVDGYIDTLPLEQKTNPEILKNCYYVAMGKKQQELKEGKLKSRFAATSTNSTGNNNTKDKDTITLTELQKKAAKSLGISEEDYGKTAREMNYV